MKIHPTIPTSPVSPAATDPRAPERAEQTDPGPGTRVSLSGDARWVASVAEEARRGPEVREEVVAQIKDALEAGTYESEVDFDALLTRLLAEL